MNDAHVVTIILHLFWASDNGVHRYFNGRFDSVAYRLHIYSRLWNRIRRKEMVHKWL